MAHALLCIRSIQRSWLAALPPSEREQHKMTDLYLWKQHLLLQTPDTRAQAAVPVVLPCKTHGAFDNICKQATEQKHKHRAVRAPRSVQKVIHLWRSLCAARSRHGGGASSARGWRDLSDGAAEFAQEVRVIHVLHERAHAILLDVLEHVLKFWVVPHAL